MSAETIRILLVDDQPMLRLGYRMILEAEPDLAVVGEAGDGQAAITAAAELEPDVVLMDIRMPGLDGVEATRAIITAAGDHDRPAADNGPKIIVLTTFDLDEYVYGALRAGASGFLLKDVPRADMVAAIRTIAAGDAVISPKVTRQLLDRFATSLPHPTTATTTDLRADGLTPRERELVLEIADGLSNSEIATKLVLSEKTVKTHVSNILAKLELRDRVQIAVFVYQTGLIDRTS
jgi:DNA-binding NarL/FixJ family response regulator